MAPTLTIRGMARVAEGWLQDARFFGVGFDGLQKAEKQNVVRPQNHEGVAIGTDCRRILTKASQTILVTTKAPEPVRRLLVRRIRAGRRGPCSHREWPWSPARSAIPSVASTRSNPPT